MKDEALKLALEALACTDSEPGSRAFEREEEAITAIKQALAAHQWVGLTDDEMVEAMGYWSEDCRSAYGGATEANGEYVDMISTWRYIEAKLKEKNT